MINWPKIHKKSWWIIGFVVVGLAELLVLIYVAEPFSARSQEPYTIKAPQSILSATTSGDLHYGMPRRLQIPKIGVDAEVVYMGMMASGEMESPKGPAEVGWYKRGPRPGEKGSSVIAGHFGWPDRQAVFDNLHKLTKGDRLNVLDDQGKSVAFVVREIDSFSPDTATDDIFKENDFGRHLNLITCFGDWDESKGTFRRRLVVFTDLAS